MSFKKILLWTVIVLAIVTTILLAIVYSFMEIKLSSIDGKGELIETIESPNENYQADTYVLYGNTSDQDQVRVSITSIKNDEGIKDKTVYWLYPAGKALPKVTWTSEEKLKIADQTIDITDESTYYNWRKDKKLTE